MSGLRLTARLPISTFDTVAQSAVFTHLPLRGQRRDRRPLCQRTRPHRLPCFTRSTTGSQSTWNKSRRLEGWGWSVN